MQTEPPPNQQHEAAAVLVPNASAVTGCRLCGRMVHSLAALSPCQLASCQNQRHCRLIRSLSAAVRPCWLASGLLACAG